MSFKYRLILFYIIIEVFFITLIVGVNFSALNNASKELTNQRITSNSSIIEELIKVPLSIYDLATLDNIVEKFVDSNSIDSLLIYDNQELLLSSKSKNNSFFDKDLDYFKNIVDQSNINEDLYIKYIDVVEDNILLGSFVIIFDLESSNNFIEENQIRTLLIILFEILISLFISYYTGNKLTNMLDVLSQKATEIGEEKYPEIPYLELNDEIGTLAKSMDKMKDDLKAKKDNILQMQKQKDNFFANMSHELKTPLNSINIISSVMLKNRSNTLNQSELKNIEIVNKCGKDLLLLINDILDITKLEAGELKLNIQNFDFDLLCTDIENMFTMSASEKGIGFICEKDDSISIINNDEIRIKQILINLIGNAIKFTSHGNVSLKIKDLGESIEFKVKDDGIGISEDKQELIFERFKQIDEGMSRRYGGTGLGLAICKDLTQLLNGEISVSSKLNIGSEFTVIIQKNFNNSNYTNKLVQNISESKNEDKTKKTKKQLVSKSYNILILNTDIVAFMPYTIELRRSAKSLLQVHNINKFANSVKEKNYDVIIINLDEFSQEDILNVLKSTKINKLILISKDKLEINEELIKLSTNEFVIPLIKDEFISSVLS